MVAPAATLVSVTSLTRIVILARCSNTCYKRETFRISSSLETVLSLSNYIRWNCAFPTQCGGSSDRLWQNACKKEGRFVHGPRRFYTLEEEVELWQHRQVVQLWTFVTRAPKFRTHEGVVPDWVRGVRVWPKYIHHRGCYLSVLFGSA